MYFAFIDDVTFGRSGQYGDALLVTLRYRAESDVYECLVFVFWCKHFRALT